MKYTAIPLTALSLTAGLLQAGPRLNSILEPIFTTPLPYAAEVASNTEEKKPTEPTPKDAAPKTHTLAEGPKNEETHPPTSVEEKIIAAPENKPTAPEKNLEPTKTASAEAPAAPTPFFLEEAALLDVLHNTLQEAYHPKGELEIRLSRNWAPLPLPDRSWNIKMIYGISDALASYMTVRFEITSGSVTMGPFVAGLRCNVWQEGWVSRGDLKRGSALNHDDFTLARVDALKTQSTLASLDTAFENMELARRVPPNRALTQADMMPSPLVRRGEIFDIVAEEGNLHIGMKGMALENGLEGDVIQVRNLNSNKVIHARITPNKKGKVSF